jgi:hypothetical protein
MAQKVYCLLCWRRVLQVVLFPDSIIWGENSNYLLSVVWDPILLDSYSCGNNISRTEELSNILLFDHLQQLQMQFKSIFANPVEN